MDSGFDRCIAAVLRVPSRRRVLGAWHPAPAVLLWRGALIAMRRIGAATRSPPFPRLACRSRRPSAAQGQARLHIFFPARPATADLWNTNRELSKRQSSPCPATRRSSLPGRQRQPYGQPGPFSRRGQSGKRISDLIPWSRQCVDDIAFVLRSPPRINTTARDAPMNTGFVFAGFPANGSWATFALGTENQDLPAFV